jgi:hypothetical protein
VSVAPVPTTSTQPARTRTRAGVRLDAPALWAGVAIASMWLAVLFVGLFGGDIVSNTTSAGTTIPAGVALGVFAMFATVPVARWGFGGRSVTDLRAALDDERRAREALALEVEALRRRLPDTDQR